jgi:hypothetical protein
LHLSISVLKLIKAIFNYYTESGKYEKAQRKK